MNTFLLNSEKLLEIIFQTISSLLFLLSSFVYYIYIYTHVYVYLFYIHVCLLYIYNRHII